MFRSRNFFRSLPAHLAMVVSRSYGSWSPMHYCMSVSARNSFLLRNLCISQAHSQQLPPSTIVLSMPQLSPTMTHGKVSKWLVAPGDTVNEYDLLMEVQTDSLTEEAYKVGDFAGTVTLLIESQEDGIMGPVLVQEGKEVPVGTPIALFSENELDAPRLAELTDQIDVPTLTSSGMKTLTWQSYLKTGSSTGCGCS